MEGRRIKRWTKSRQPQEPRASPENKMFKFASLLALASLVPAFVEAQQPLYAQCGGNGWCK